MKRILFKLLRYGFFGLVCLVTLLALIVAEENYRGKRAWENYRRDAEARGVKLDYSAIIPPPVPDDQNFAMTPLLKPLFGNDPGYKAQLGKRLRLPEPKAGRNTPSFGNRVTQKRIDLAEWSAYLGEPDVLHALKRYDPEMDEISSAASRRPHSRLPLRYDDGFKKDLPHLTPFLSLAKLFAIRGAANLAEAHPSEALADCQTLLRLSDAVEGDRTLISALVGTSMLSMSETVLWQGLSAHGWNEVQLAALQDDFQRIDPLGDGLRACQGERLAFSASIEKVLDDRNHPGQLSLTDNLGPVIAQFPRCWLYQNMISCCRFYEKEVFPAFDPVARRINPLTVRSGSSAIHGASLAHPYRILADMALPAVFEFIPKFASSQTAADEAAIACALERYRLVHSEYPGDLNALVPQYFSKLPHDVITGEPLHYNRTGDGQFILYSVGWDGKDDHGTIALKQGSSQQQEITQGDWVWR
jgi:hypothetical protein